MSEATGSTSIVGTPAPAPGPAPAPSPSPAPSPAPAPAWYDGVGEETIAWAKGRGIKLDDPAEVARHALSGHFNAEKLIGLDRAGRTVAIPKDDAPAAEWDAYYAKLGRPADVKGYKVPEALKDDAVMRAFLDVAHKAGYTQKQIDPVVQFIGQQTEALTAQTLQQVEAKAAADYQALQQEWGGEFQLRSEAARRAARELGISEEEGGIIEQALGLKRSAELFFKIGKGLLEPQAEGMGGSAGASPFGLTPAEAKAKIQTLTKDAEFAAKLGKGDAAAKIEWERLHKIAFPG